MTIKNYVGTETSRDPYAPTIEIGISLPLLFRELCRMLEVEPVRVLVVDFTRELMQPASFNEGFLNMSKAAEYFASIKHKKHLFTPEQIKVMIYDLIVLKDLFPVRSEVATEEDEYSIIQNACLSAWKKKWQAEKQGNVNKK